MDILKIPLYRFILFFFRQIFSANFSIWLAQSGIIWSREFIYSSFLIPALRSCTVKIMTPGFLKTFLLVSLDYWCTDVPVNDVSVMTLLQLRFDDITFYLKITYNNTGLVESNKYLIKVGHCFFFKSNMAENGSIFATMV